MMILLAATAMPKVRVKFTTREPITFPIASEKLFRFTALMFTNNSGSVVPNATIVAPINVLPMPNVSANFIAESDTNLALTIIIPIISRINKTIFMDSTLTKTFFSSFSSNSLPPSRTAFIETTNIIMQNIPKTIFIVPRTRAKTAIIDVIIIAWDIWSKSFLIILNPEISAVMPNTTPISIILAPNKVPAAIRDESLNIEIMLIDNSGSEVATASNKNPVVPWLKPVISENLTAYSITHLLVLIKINSPMINIRISGIIYIIAWLVIYKGAR